MLRRALLLAAICALGALLSLPQIASGAGPDEAKSRVGAFEQDLGDRAGGQSSDLPAKRLVPTANSGGTASAYLVAARGADGLARFSTNRQQRFGRLATAGTQIGKVRNFDVPDPGGAANRVARSLTQGPGVTVALPRPGVTVHSLPEGGQVVLRSPAGSRSELWAVDVYNVPGAPMINTHFRGVPGR